MRAEMQSHPSQRLDQTESQLRRGFPSSLLPSHFLLLTYLLCLPIYCLLRVFQWDEALRLATFVIPCLLFAFALAHAIESIGIKWAALFLGSGALISLVAEGLGTATGLLFGNYTYTEQLGGKLFGLVPWLIPIAWCGMLYLSWRTVAFLLLGRDENRTGSADHGFSNTNLHESNESPQMGEKIHPIRGDSFDSRRFVFTALLHIVLSALAITAWDLSLDPRMVQDGNWIWRDGGLYFGIPISNFIGWFVTAACIYAVWTLMVRRMPQPAPIRSTSHRHALLPVAAYLLVWLGESMANVLFWAGPLVGLCVFVGMGVFAVPALVRLIKAKAF